MKKLTATFVIAAVLLNAMAPTLAHAATYLQGAEVNANTLVKDAYVQVTYYDCKGKQRLEKGWIYAVGETTFEIETTSEIRSRAIFGKETIAYDKVVSLIMSDESTTPTKQIREVDRFMRERAKEDRVQTAIQTLNHKPVTVMVRGQIDSSQVPWNTYVHVVYTSDGKKENATGRVVKKTASSIITLQNTQQDGKIAYDNIAYSNIAYDNMDTLLVANDWQDIERYRELGAQHNAKVRVKAIYKKRITGRLVNMTQDTLVIQSGHTFFQVPRSSISNLEVSIGKRRNTGKGFKIGLGAGIGMAILINVSDGGGGDLEGLVKALATAVIVPPIIVIPTLIGAMTKSDNWVEVSPQNFNLSLVPTSTKGLRAALTFNF